MDGKKLEVSLKDGVLKVDGCEYKVTCDVRSVANNRRKRDEVVRTIPAEVPYDPRPFPKGTWDVVSVEWGDGAGAGKSLFDASVYGPVKIRTNAWQNVNVWKLDKDGDYEKETPALVRDEGYLLHYSNSKTTLGCIRLNSIMDARKLAKDVESWLKLGKVSIEVV